MAAAGVPVIVLAERAEPADALAAAQLGAHALLTKNCSLAELTVAIRSVSSGAPAAPAARLTARQRQVLELIVEGLDNSQIADRLGVSERTARAHVSAVLERLGVANRTQAAVAAIQRGWLAALTVLLVLLILAPRRRAGGEHSVGAAGGARPADAVRRRRVRRLGGRRIRTRRLRVEGRCQAGAGVGAEAGHHGGRARPPGPGGPVRDRGAWPDGTITEGVLDGDLYLRGSGDPSFGTAALRRLARQGRRDRPGRRGRPHLRGRELFRPPPRRLRLRDLALRRAAVRAGLQPRIDAAAGSGMAERSRHVRGRPDARHAAIGAGRRGPACARRQSACRRDHPGHDRVAAARGTGPAHQPGVGQLLRRDAAEGPGRPVGHDRLHGSGRRNRVEVRARAGLSRPRRGRLRPVAGQLDLAPRRRPAAARRHRTSRGSTPSTARCRWRARPARSTSGCAAPPPRAAAAPRPARSPESAPWPATARHAAGNAQRSRC